MICGFFFTLENFHNCLPWLIPCRRASLWLATPRRARMLPKTKISEKITTNLSASFGKSWCSFRQQTEWRRRVWLCIWGEFQNTMRRMLCLGVIWRLCLVRHYWDPGKIPYNYDNNPWGYFLFYRFFGRLVVRGEGRRGVLSCYKWIPANCRRRIGIQKSAVQRDVS